MKGIALSFACGIAVGFLIYKYWILQESYVGHLASNVNHSVNTGSKNPVPDNLEYDQVGKDNAKIVWLTTWSKIGSSSCTTNSDFNKFLKKNGIDVSSAATRAIADFAAIGGNILGLGKNLSKMLSVAVPVLMGSVIVVAIILLMRAAKKADVVDLAMLASGGAGQVALAARQVGK